MKTTRIVTVAVLDSRNCMGAAIAVGGQAGSTPANENREEQSNMSKEKVIIADRSKNLAATPHSACRGRRAIPAIGASGTGCGSVLCHGAKGRSNTFVFYEIYRSQ